MHHTRDLPRVDRHGEVRRTADRTTRRRQHRITAGVNEHMTHANAMRRQILVALILTVTLTIIPSAVRAAITQEVKQQAERVSAKICDYDWRRGSWQIKQLIRCAARRWPVPGGAVTALHVADRESHYDPQAFNPSGCAGIYQHMLAYWPGRASNFGFHGWSAYNARANIIVTMRMVHQSGWGPWS